MILMCHIIPFVEHFGLLLDFLFHLAFCSFFFYFLPLVGLVFLSLMSTWLSCRDSFSPRNGVDFATHLNPNPPHTPPAELMIMGSRWGVEFDDGRQNKKKNWRLVEVEISVIDFYVFHCEGWFFSFMDSATPHQSPFFSPVLDLPLNLILPLGIQVYVCKRSSCMLFLLAFPNFIIKNDSCFYASVNVSG